MFRASEELEAAKVEYASSRPFTTFGKRMWHDIPQVEIDLRDQPSYLSQMLEWMGVQKDFLTLQQSQFEEILKAFRAIEREGRPNVAIHNSRFTYPDAATQHRHIVNGETRLRKRVRP